MDDHLGSSVEFVLQKGLFELTVGGFAVSRLSIRPETKGSSLTETRANMHMPSVVYEALSAWPNAILSFPTAIPSWLMGNHNDLQ